jgi:hypothetical protein
MSITHHAEVTVRTPNICSDFSGDQGDQVQWQGAPNGCQISQYNNTTWPFNLPSPITLPSPSIIKINVGTGSYSFWVSCCPQQMAMHTVNVS